MIRRLFTLVWAVAGRSKTISDLVALVWPRSSAETSPAPASVGEAVTVAPVAPVAAIVAAAPAPALPEAAAEPEPESFVASVVEPVAQAVVAAAAQAEVVPPAAEPVAGEAAAAPVAPDEDIAPPPPPELRPLGQKEAMDGSVWVPRILWALEFAKLRDLGPQSASDISRVLGEHSGLNVPSPNVARAFRDRKQQGASYWKEVDSQRYEISRAGSAALRKQLRSSEN